MEIPLTKSFFHVRFILSCRKGLLVDVPVLLFLALCDALKSYQNQQDTPEPIHLTKNKPQLDVI
jgi:hypothetical protein